MKPILVILLISLTFTAAVGQRKIEDKERLQSADLTPVIMDVQDRSTIFAAAEQIMDRIKEVAPIWKKEVWADGASEWVGSEAQRKAGSVGPSSGTDTVGSSRATWS